MWTEKGSDTPRLRRKEPARCSGPNRDSSDPAAAFSSVEEGALVTCGPAIGSGVMAQEALSRPANTGGTSVESVDK